MNTHCVCICVYAVCVCVCTFHLIDELNLKYWTMYDGTAHFTKPGMSYLSFLVLTLHCKLAPAEKVPKSSEIMWTAVLI